MRVLVSSLLHLVLLIGGVVGRDPLIPDAAPPSSSFSEVAAETSTCRSDMTTELSPRAKDFLVELNKDSKIAREDFPMVNDTDPMKAYIKADKMERQHAAMTIWKKAVTEVVDEKDAASLRDTVDAEELRDKMKRQQAVKRTLIKVHKQFNKEFFLKEKAQGTFKEIGTMEATKWNKVQAVFVMGGRASKLNREGAFQSMAGTIIDDFVDLQGRDFKVYSHAYSKPNSNSKVRWPTDYVYTFGNEDKKIKAFAESIQKEVVLAKANKVQKFVVIYYTYAKTAGPHTEANDQNVLHAKKLKTAMEGAKVDKSFVRIVHIATAASLNKQFWSEESDKTNRFSIDCLKNDFAHYGVSKIFQSFIWADYFDPNIIKDVFDAVRASYDAKTVCSNDPKESWSAVGSANFVLKGYVEGENIPIFEDLDCKKKLKDRALEISNMVQNSMVHKEGEVANRFWSTNKKPEKWDIYSKQVWADVSHILFRETAGQQSVVAAVPNLETVLVTWVPTDPTSRVIPVVFLLQGKGFRGKDVPLKDPSKEGVVVTFPENGIQAVQGAIIAMGETQNLDRFRWVTTPQMIARRAQKVAEDNFV